MGQLGQQVPEKYLDDRHNLKGTRIIEAALDLTAAHAVSRSDHGAGRQGVAHPKWLREMRTSLACNS